MSFAQFEREVTGERIRDKFAASKAKGMWMGGVVPLGYDVQARRLVVNDEEAETVRTIFALYRELGCVRRLKQELDARGLRSKARPGAGGRHAGGAAFSRGALYTLLRNPLYAGRVRHKEKIYEGQHEAIIDAETWAAVQVQLQGNGPGAKRTAGGEPSLLAGKLVDEAGERLTPTHARKAGRRYRYYVSRHLITRDGEEGRPGWRLPAGALERVVREAVMQALGDSGALVTALQNGGVDPERIPRLLAAATTHRQRLGSGGDTPAVLDALLRRVQLQSGGLVVDLDLRGLLPAGAVPADAGVTLTTAMPMAVQRRGVEMKLVIPGGTASPTAKVDPALLKALARAHAWMDELVSGRAPSIEALAAREGIGDRYLRRLLPLATLAPDIITAIVAGRQPVALTAEVLTYPAGLPLDWEGQRKALGFT